MLATYPQFGSDSDSEPEICPKCGSYVDNPTTGFNYTTGWCLKCSPHTPNTKATERLANHVEHYMVLLGISAYRATILVHAEERPTCIVCGQRIKYARPDKTVFCRVNDDCRKWQRRYQYLYQKKGLTKTQALAKVLSEITE